MGEQAADDGPFRQPQVLETALERPGAFRGLQFHDLQVRLGDGLVVEHAVFVHHLLDELRGGNYDLGIDVRGDFRVSLLMWLAGVKYRIGYGCAGGGFLLNEAVPFDAKTRENRHQIDHNINLIKFTAGRNIFLDNLEVVNGEHRVIKIKKLPHFLNINLKR